MIIKQTFGALAFLCAIGASANGDVPTGTVFFDNFGPGNSYTTNSGFAFGGQASGPQFESAMAFMPLENYLLTAGEFGVSVALDLTSVFGPFEIAVHADDGDGLPGAVLEQVTVDEELGGFGFQNPPVVVNFAGTTALNAGKRYWISMSANPGMFGIWNANNEGDIGPQGFQLDGGGWQVAEDVPRGAFRLYGTPVPSPGAIALMGLFARTARGRRRIAGGDCSAP